MFCLLVYCYVKVRIAWLFWLVHQYQLAFLHFFNKLWRPPMETSHPKPHPFGSHYPKWMANLPSDQSQDPNPRTGDVSVQHTWFHCTTAALNTVTPCWTGEQNIKRIYGEQNNSPRKDSPRMRSSRMVETSADATTLLVESLRETMEAAGRSLATWGRHIHSILFLSCTSKILLILYKISYCILQPLSWVFKIVFF